MPVPPVIWCVFVYAIFESTLAASHDRHWQLHTCRGRGPARAREQSDGESEWLETGRREGGVAKTERDAVRESARERK